MYDAPPTLSELSVNVCAGQCVTSVTRTVRSRSQSRWAAPPSAERTLETSGWAAAALTTAVATTGRYIYGHYCASTIE